MKENVIKVLKVKPHEHPEVCMLKNTLETIRKTTEKYIDIVKLIIIFNDEGNTEGEILIF